MTPKAPPKVAVVADSHLGGPGGDGERLVDQLRALPRRGIERLVLLGDIFHVWVGSRRFETPEVRRLVPIWRELRAGGMRLEYIEGNRDFFIGESPYADAFDAVALETSFVAADGRRILAVHGDRLNQRDYQYRFWRWLSKSPPSRFGILHLPGPLARRAVHSTEARLAKTNFRHRKRLPEAAIRGYAEKRLAEGHDELILGHFHEPHAYEVSGGRVRLLDAWFRSHRIELF